MINSVSCARAVAQFETKQILISQLPCMVETVNSKYATVLLNPYPWEGQYQCESCGRCNGMFANNAAI